MRIIVISNRLPVTIKRKSDIDINTSKNDEKDQKECRCSDNENDSDITNVSANECSKKCSKTSKNYPKANKDNKENTTITNDNNKKNVDADDTVDSDSPFIYIKSSGGLVTGLISLSHTISFLWVGTLIDKYTDAEKAIIQQDLKKMGLYPVFITEEMNDKAYTEFCNDVLWPNIHYFCHKTSNTVNNGINDNSNLTSKGNLGNADSFVKADVNNIGFSKNFYTFNNAAYKVYKKYNKMFFNYLEGNIDYMGRKINANENKTNINTNNTNGLEGLINDGDVVWVHDYHFFLLPYFIRRYTKHQNLKILFFLHTCFTDYDVIKQFPYLKEIVLGMLCADQVAVHTHEYKKNIMEAIQNIKFSKEEMAIIGRRLKIDDENSIDDYNYGNKDDKNIGNNEKAGNDDTMKNTQIFEGGVNKMKDYIKNLIYTEDKGKNNESNVNIDDKTTQNNIKTENKEHETTTSENPQNKDKGQDEKCQKNCFTTSPTSKAQKDKCQIFSILHKKPKNILELKSKTKKSTCGHNSTKNTIDKNVYININHRIVNKYSCYDLLGREFNIKTIPIGINKKVFEDVLKKDETKQKIKEIRNKFKNKTIILGVDRVDYIKGIPQRIAAIEKLIKDPKYKDLSDNFVFIQVGVPSRGGVPEYSSLSDAIIQDVSLVNSTNKGLLDNYIFYLNGSVSMEELCALYNVSDICLVTSYRDGMNLVCMEYVICQGENGKGVLVLSEFTGALATLPGAVYVNPFCSHTIAETIYETNKMNESERIERNKINYINCSKFDAELWARRNFEDITEFDEQK